MRTERCACRGSITADEADPADAVMRHASSRQHARWRDLGGMEAGLGRTRGSWAELEAEKVMPGPRPLRPDQYATRQPLVTLVRVASGRRAT